MDFDGVVQVLITVGFVAFWLFGVGRKKRPPPQQVSRDLDTPPQQVSRDLDAPPQQISRDLDGHDPVTKKSDTERMIMQALGLLEGTDPVGPLPVVQAIEVPEEFEPYEAEAETRPFRPEAESRPLRPEAQTLMVGSSPAEQARRHEVFHDRFIHDLPEVGSRLTPPRKKRRFDRSSIREAIIWREILGPPKAME